MIKLVELLNEAIKENFGDIVELELSEFEPALKAIFTKKYPDSNLYFLQEDLMYVSTDEEEPDAGSMYGSGRSGDYYLAFNAYIEDEVLTILIENATAGNYKGVTGDFLKAIFNKAKQSHGPIAKSVLSIRGDRSGGKWQEIASRIGVEYEDDDHPAFRRD